MRCNSIVALNTWHIVAHSTRRPAKTCRYLGRFPSIIDTNIPSKSSVQQRARQAAAAQHVRSCSMYTFWGPSRRNGKNPARIVSFCFMSPLTLTIIYRTRAQGPVASSMFHAPRLSQMPCERRSGRAAVAQRSRCKHGAAHSRCPGKSKHEIHVRTTHPEHCCWCC